VKPITVFCFLLDHYFSYFHLHWMPLQNFM